jgi:SAM-dependent methyltransferase
MKKFIKKIVGIEKLIKKVDAETIRDQLVQNELKTIPNNGLLLDAGCGNQKYRAFSRHLIYKAQDLGEYIKDEKENISTSQTSIYEIGPLDYRGNVWDINESDQHFDAILCTEVFEHIPYPIEAVREFSRLIKPKGKLIITIPAASNRHFDPFYYYSGFSDRWINYFLDKNGFEEIKITPIGDYFSYVMINMYTIAINAGWIVRILLAPGIYCMSKMKKTTGSVNYQCNGYFVTAIKK